MNAVDIQNAFNGSKADNFTVLMLRLIAHSDECNRDKLALSYPTEVEAVKIYQKNCPYVIVDAYHPELNLNPDWDCINEWAHMATANKPGSTGSFPDGKVAEDDEGELKLAVFIDSKQNVVGVDFGKSVRWIAFGKEEAKTLAKAISDRADLLD